MTHSFKEKLECHAFYMYKIQNLLYFFFTFVRTRHEKYVLASLIKIIGSFSHVLGFTHPLSAKYHGSVKGVMST